jgi:selenocysteine lyase/cysteine desulfurase
VASVSLDETVWRTGPSRHEAGSPNVIGVAALARALQELDSLDEAQWAANESALRERLTDGFAALPEVRVHRIFSDSSDPVGVVSFTVDGVDSRLLATYLSAEWGIGLRDGKFCAHPLLVKMGVTRPALRASFGVGSVDEDADRLLEAVTSYLRVGPRWQYALVDGHWEVVDDNRPRPDWAPELAASVGFYGCAA